MFVKWVIHGSAAVYLLLVPWMLFGLIGVVRPNWILGMTRAFDKTLEDAASVIRSKAANGGQVKTGQRMWPGT